METLETSKIVDMYNGGMSLQEIGEKISVSKSTIQRRIAKDGYILNKITKKYENNVSIETINQENVVSHKTNVSRETNKKEKQEKMVNRTYAISERIERAMKIKSAVEGKKPIDIVREALESYIESKYFDM